MFSRSLNLAPRRAPGHAGTCVVLTGILLLCGAGRARGDDYFPPPDTAGGWRVPKDAAELHDVAKMDAARLEEAYGVAEHSTRHGGLLVVHNGYLVLERYFGRGHRNGNPDMASTGKAVTSVAVGVMLHEFHDKIPEGLDTKVFTSAFLPEALPLPDPREAQISLGQLLCMTAGFTGEGGSPVGVVNGAMVKMKPGPGQDVRTIDESSLHVPLWTDPGAGYSYASCAPHIASMVLRHVSGMELREYVNERLAKPMGWGAWDYCLHRGDFTMPHANGAGSTALHATDALRFGHCLLHQGKWADKQLVPAEYVALLNKPSPYNPHSPFTLQFEQNSDGHVAFAPRDAFWKSGAGGFCIYVVPSLDLVIYKLGGPDAQWDPALTGLPDGFHYDGSRDNWQPTPRTPFNDGSLQGDDGLRRILELVCAGVRK